MVAAAHNSTHKDDGSKGKAGTTTSNTHLRTDGRPPTRSVNHMRLNENSPNFPGLASHHVVIERHILRRHPQLRHRGRERMVGNGGSQARVVRRELLGNCHSAYASHRNASSTPPGTAHLSCLVRQRF